MRRRCAGCHAVIDGRPNKLYCSHACREKGNRARKSVTKSVTDSGAVPSVIRGSNGKLIARVARLGYLGEPGDLVLDVTPGRQLWWTVFRPAGLRLGEGDFRHRPEPDDSVRVVCYDPPYISTGSRQTSTIDDFYDRYGLGELKGWRAIRQLIDDGLTECARILEPSGFLLAKCKDYVEADVKRWNTFHVAAFGETLGLELVDRFHHLGRGGPQVDTNLNGSPREQKHAREVTSMLLVFTK